MQRESNWRNYATVFVTALCLMLIYPTLRYVHFVYTQPEPVRTESQTEEQYQQELDDWQSRKEELQRKSIKLGLDLVGGVDVTLTIDKEKTLTSFLREQGDDLLRELSDKQIDAQIAPNDKGDRLVVELADKANAAQVLPILEKKVENKWFEDFDQSAFQSTGKAEIALSPLVLDKRLSDNLSSVVNSIRNRVDTFGVTMPSVSQQGKTAVRVQVPGERDGKKLIEEVIRPAQLQFYALYTDNTDSPSFSAHDAKVKELFEPVEWPRRGGDVETRNYVRYKIKEDNETAVGFRLKEGKKLPTGYIVLPGKPLTPELEAKSDIKEPVGKVFIVKRNPEMNGSDLREAYMQNDPSDLQNPISVSIQFGKTGAPRLAKLSRDYLQKRVAIALDGNVYSAPKFESVIPSGSGRITGSFTADEAHSLALVLKAGSLQAELKSGDTRVIGPTLGAESIVKSMKAMAISAICISAFMIVYYGTAGVISIVALVLNLLVVIACLNLFNATLTLSGIGGIILTIGMAVDTNVLIYERMREELENGRTLATALRAGFDRAFAVIFDSHLTILLSAFSLLQFGQGSIQGFALTMVFGLVANLFTGLTVTFALCLIYFNLRKTLSLGKLHIFRNPTLDFINLRKLTFPFSGFMVVAALLFLIVRGGPEMAVDFKGGVVTEVRLEGDGDQTEAIKKVLSQQGESQARIQKVINENTYIIRSPLLKAPTADVDANRFTQETIEGMLKAAYPDEKQMKIVSSTSVSPEVGQQFTEIAIMVTLVASLSILVYLWFRFELVFGVAAVIALLHDLTITLGLMTLLGFQTDLDIVSALMIMLGFSVNDTIVIFDRVRENSHTMFGRSFKDICNAAMNRSLGRTIITSGTAVLTMVVMFFIGGRSLQPFALTLIIGGIVGTYSSDFIAAPLVYWWNERDKGKLMEHLGRKGTGPVTTVEGQPAATAAMATVATSGEAAARRRGRR
jgi:SecD/SecF fusion protein